MLHPSKYHPAAHAALQVVLGVLVSCMCVPGHAREAGLAEKAKQLATAAGDGFKSVREAFVSGAVGVQEQGRIEVAFSPNQGAEDLVLRVTESAQKDLRVMAYAFTSSKITAAMVRAAKRGVNVYLLADEKQNLGEGAGAKGRAALTAMSLAGVHVRIVGAYPIFHDKVQIGDGRVVQTGSFNFSDAAARKNSENVIVHWNNPELAAAYADHFSRNWKLSKPFAPSY